MNKYSMKIKAAYKPWEDPELTEQGKKYWSSEENRQQFLKEQKLRLEKQKIYDEAMELAIIANSYFSYTDEYPNDKTKVVVNKSGVEQLLDKAKTLETLLKKADKFG